MTEEFKQVVRTYVDAQQKIERAVKAANKPGISLQKMQKLYDSIQPIYRECYVVIGENDFCSYGERREK